MSSLFQKFLDSKYGLRVLEEFNNMKEEIENPSEFIVKLLKGKTNPNSYLDIGGGNGIRTMEIIEGLKPKHTLFLEPSGMASIHFSKLAKSKKK
jgi:hypothetical protein